MPLLTVEDLKRLNDIAPHACAYCRHAVRRNYCRQCDVFFDAGHMEGCQIAQHEGSHETHRTY
ncbi:MAG: hypothetical protein RLZZ324_151 [Candidatus Parcubacteria bacterium]